MSQVSKLTSTMV